MQLFQTIQEKLELKEIFIKMTFSNITQKIEQHKSTIINELSQTEEALKKELKRYGESLTEQMKSDLTKLQNSSKLQEQEQKENISKLLKWVSWKVLTLTSILSIIIAVVATILIINQTSSQKLQNIIKEKTIEATDGQYLKFQANELIYDQQKQVYYYKIK